MSVKKKCKGNVNARLESGALRNEAGAAISRPAKFSSHRPILPRVFICICSQRRFVEKTDAVLPKQQNSASKPGILFLLL